MAIWKMMPHCTEIAPFAYPWPNFLESVPLAPISCHVSNRWDDNEITCIWAQNKELLHTWGVIVALAWRTASASGNDLERAFATTGGHPPLNHPLPHQSERVAGKRISDHMRRLKLHHRVIVRQAEHGRVNMTPGVCKQHWQSYWIMAICIFNRGSQAQTELTNSIFLWMGRMEM